MNRKRMVIIVCVCVCVSARLARLRPHTSSVLLPQAPLTPPNLIWRQWVQLHGSHGGQLCSSGSATHTHTLARAHTHTWTNSYDSVPCCLSVFMKHGTITFNLFDDALISPAGVL